MGLTGERRKAWVMGQVEVYSYLVARGKPAACLMVPRACRQAALQVVQSEGCRSHVEEIPQAEWVNLWIYQKPFILEVIKSLPVARSCLPASAQRWYEGCLFGYSLEKIEPS
jgi:hypothetical protein